MTQLVYQLFYTTFFDPILLYLKNKTCHQTILRKCFQGLEFQLNIKNYNNWYVHRYLSWIKYRKKLQKTVDHVIELDEWEGIHTVLPIVFFINFNSDLLQNNIYFYINFCLNSKILNFLFLLCSKVEVWNLA